MRKLIALVPILLFLLIGCAGNQIKYEPRPFTPPAKVPDYKLPLDPFANTPAPVGIFLKKDPSGKFVLCPKEEATIVGYTSKELDRITLRLQYLKTQNTQLVELINIHVMRQNVLIDIVIDKNLVTEIYRQLFVDMQNKMSSEQFWNKVEKSGQWLVIIGLLIEMGILVI